MPKLSFNQINSLKGIELTPAQKHSRTKVQLSRPKMVRNETKPGNNDRCPCGSGLKYKNCYKYS